jgi:glycosyltransferase involved in cell wall biosynthesis
MAKKSILPRHSSAERRRVLYIITKSVWGGAAKYVFDLATNLADEFEVTVAAGGKNKLYQEIKKANIPYFNIDNFQRTINPLKDVFAFFEVLGLLFQIKPDVIHVNSSKAGGVAGLAGWIYNLFSNKKANLIFTAHGWAINEDRPKWQIEIIKLSSKLTSIFYDKIICVSEYDKKTAIKFKLASENKLTVIHNGINIDNIKFLDKEEAQKKLINKTSPLIIGTIAEWTKNKGLIYLLKAVKELKNEKFDLILIGSGENPDKEKMDKLTRKYKNIHLIKYIPDAVKYLKAFDIFVLPSLKEGLPYTIIEAMATKVPIIASNIGGIPEMIIDKETGFLINPKNPELIKEKIEYILSNPEKIKRITEKAKQKAEQEFSLKQMVEKTKEIY